MSSSISDPSMPIPRASRPPTRALTLIVATTPTTSTSNPSIRRLGIGHNGTLPWPRIKADMGFFARVTTRPPSVPPSSPPRDTPSSTLPASTAGGNSSSRSGAGESVINAAIMGRKTYDSIPERFRPLSKRFNVVITRDESGAVRERVEADWRAARRREREKRAEKKKATDEEQATNDGKTDGLNDVAGGSAKTGELPQAEEEDQRPDVLVSGSLESALADLASAFPASSKRKLGNIYVIGGAEIYASALRLDPSTGYKLRILMTDVRKRQTTDSAAVDCTPTPSIPPDSDPRDAADGFGCSTFFPLDLTDLEGGKLWRQAEPSEVTEWVGEEVSGQWKWEGDIALRMCGYERIETPTE